MARRGDREHAANLHWLTGFDPRFEEALLVVRPEDALLIAGNECLPYTGISPLVERGAIRVAHCASFSLISQPRGTARLADGQARFLSSGAPSPRTRQSARTPCHKPSPHWCPN